MVWKISLLGILVLLNMVGLCFRSAVGSDITQGLSAYWKFDEGEGDIAFDSAGGELHATIGQAEWVAGRIGKALFFDGKVAFASSPDAGAPGVGGALSVALWIKGVAQPTDIWVYALGKEDSFGLLISRPGGPNLGFLVRNEDGSGWNRLLTGVDILDGSWHHVVATYDGNAISVFLDGNLLGCEIVGPSAPVSASPLVIGAYSLRYGYFRGTIDEVRLYNRALSEEEIAELCQGEDGHATQ